MINVTGSQNGMRSPLAVGPLALPADCFVPRNATGLVIFAHGSGSSRLSPRNRYVASALNAQGFATLLFDLLREDEAEDRHNVFDITLLGRRMTDVVASVHERYPDLAIGLFGASTGAAAALQAAAALPAIVRAVVSRGGRPDLALDVLPLVKAPTLLIVGALDHQVIGLNRRALAALNCTKRLEIVAGASHLFEEEGTLDQVIRLAAAWYRTHLANEAAS